jgi:arabinogalactan endo-1,4-beta-galactosidase
MNKPTLFLLINLLFLTVLSYACSEDNNNDDNNKKASTALKDFVLGVDLSYVNQVEDYGGTYKENNKETDPFKLLSNKGANLTRVRIWHSPGWVKDVYGKYTTIYSGLWDVARTIRRAHENGMSALLDFHYSDTWADPDNQEVPNAWRNITSLEVLCDSVYNYTYNTLNDLYKKGLLPEMVQLGNETNPGMMVTNTPEGFPSLNVYDGNWANFGEVVNAGIKAVRDMESNAGKEIKIALHIADPKNLEWWIDNVINEGKVTGFDVMGFSYYHIWHTEIAFNDLPTLVSNLKAKYHKDFLVMETAYPFTTDGNDNYNNIYSEQTAPLEGFPYTIQGQKAFLQTLTQNMANAGALGVIYWEPDWISSNMKDRWGTGSSWENNAFFDFSCNVTEAADFLGVDYTE